MQLTHLQHIDARPSDVAQELVFLVEVATEHLRRLVHSVFDLDGDTTTGLALLDDLRRQLSEPPHFHLKKRERKTNLECDSIFPGVVSHVVLNCIVRKVHKMVWKWGSERRE